MERLFYIIAFVMAAGITTSAVYFLFWSSKTGQMRDLEKGAVSIFDNNEPIGQLTDRFPSGNRRHKSST